jgi:hypothetical protein
MTSKINIRLDRDMNGVFHAAFGFIRQNYSILFRAVTFFALPWFFVGFILIVSGFYDFIMLLSRGDVSGNGMVVLYSFLQMIPAIIFLFIGYIFYITVINEFIVMYAERPNPSTITLGDVWKASKRNFFPMLGNLLLWIVLVGIARMIAGGISMFIQLMFIGIGAIIDNPAAIIFFFILSYVFQLLVTLYIYICSFPSLILLSTDRKDAASALIKNISLVHKGGNFTGAFGFGIVSYVMIFVLYSLLFIPLGIIGGILAYNFIEPETFDPGQTWFTFVIKFGTPLVLTVFAYLNVFQVVAIAFKTLQMEERVLGTGLQRSLLSLGSEAVESNQTERSN